MVLSLSLTSVAAFDLDVFGIIGSNFTSQNEERDVESVGQSLGRYGSVDEAAEDALSMLIPLTIKYNREYGGAIYRTRQGYVIDQIIFGKRDFHRHFVLVPENRNTFGVFHTHPKYDIPSKFSKGDLETNSKTIRNNPKKVEYLGGADWVITRQDINGFTYKKLRGIE